MTGTITSLGIGSSLDLQGILDSLRAADEVTITQMEQEITEQESIQDELNTIHSKLYSMKTSALNLSLESNYISRSVSVSSEGVAGATAAEGTQTGSYNLEVTRLATQSSFLSESKALSTSTVYVPTAQQSATGFSDTDTTIILAEDEQMTINYGTGDDRRTITITGAAGGMTMDDLIEAVNTDAGNDDGSGTAVVTATRFTGDDGLNYLQIAAASGGNGEENRVMVTIPPAATGFSAPETGFSYTLGDSSEVYSISVTADTTLEELADLINEDESNPGVTASVVNTGMGDTPYQLIIKSDETGEDSRIRIVSGLEDLGFEEQNGAGASMISDREISFSDPVVVTAGMGNNQIVFSEDAGEGSTANLTAVIEDGVYSDGDSLAAAVEEALESASATDGVGADYQVSFDDATGKLSIREAGQLDSLTIEWENAGSTASSSLGFTQDRTLTPSASSLNAGIVVDNVTYQRQTNTSLTDVMDGVTLNLHSAGTTTVQIESDTSYIESEFTGFIDQFNDLLTEIDANDDYDEDTETWGTLARSSSASSAKMSLISLLITPLDTGTSLTSLVDLGIEVGEDGMISMDEDEFSSMVESNFEDVSTLFLGNDDFTGLADLFNDRIDAYVTGDNGFLQSEITAADDRITRLEEDIEAETDRLDKQYETLAQQYVELDSYMSQMESQMSYVSQIFSATSSDS